MILIDRLSRFNSFFHTCNRIFLPTLVAIYSEFFLKKRGGGAGGGNDILT